MTSQQTAELRPATTTGPGRPPEALVIRTAEPEDWRAVAALLEELGRPAVLSTPDEEHHRDRFLDYLQRTDAVALVADIDGDIVGFTNVEVRHRLNVALPQAWVPDLVVTEHHRGRGVGRALLERAEDLARRRGCWGIALESARWRLDAHTFYATMGWLDGGLSFTKSFSGLVWPPAPPARRQP